MTGRSPKQAIYVNHDIPSSVQNIGAEAHVKTPEQTSTGQIPVALDSVQRASRNVSASVKNAGVQVGALAQMGGAQVALGVSGIKLAEEAKVAWKLKTPRKIIVSGEVDGEGLFDGSNDVDIYAVVDRITNTELEAMLV